MSDNEDESEIIIEYMDNCFTKSDPLDIKENDTLTDGDSFTNEEDIAINKNWYKTIENGSYICSFCDRMYTTVTSLRHHVIVKHPKEAIAVKSFKQKLKRKSQHKCHLCKERFKCIFDLKNHVKSIHGYKNIAKSCLLCNAMFKTISEVTDHLFNNHNIIYKNIHICNICGYRTYKINRFTQHKSIHSELKSYKCKFCDYYTSHSYNLKSHEKTHAKVRV